MAADLGGFTDVLLLVGLAAGLVWWYLEKPLNFDPFGHARFAHLFVLYD